MFDTSYLDWPFFEARHRDLAVELAKWASSREWPHLGEDAAALDLASRANVAALGEAGWLRNCVVAPHGGAAEKLDVRTLCLHRDILARHGGLADFAFAMQGLGSGPISLYGSEAQRARYLPRVAEGKAIAAFAISEADAGSDVAALATRAVADGDSYVIDGEKTWISNAGIADQYVVFARTDAHPTRGISAFIVEADDVGVSVPERITTIAPHPLGKLRLASCRVAKSRMIGAPGQGFSIAMATLDIFRSTVGAAALGMARCALDEALRRVGSRQVLGGPLSAQQLTQAKLADMAVAIDTSALLVYRAAWTKDTTGARISREAAMAKLHATEQAQLVIDHALQLFGGTGVVRGVTVERLYREIRALRIYEGTSEIQRLIIARQVLAGDGGRAGGG